MNEKMKAHKSMNAEMLSRLSIFRSLGRERCTTMVITDESAETGINTNHHC